MRLCPAFKFKIMCELGAYPCLGGRGRRDGWDHGSEQVLKLSQELRNGDTLLLPHTQDIDVRCQGNQSREAVLNTAMRCRHMGSWWNCCPLSQIDNDKKSSK